MKKLGLDPVEKEIKIGYENEHHLKDDKYFIEIPKERPSWFAKNLISNSVTHRSNKQKAIVENIELEGKIIDK